MSDRWKRQGSFHPAHLSLALERAALSTLMVMGVSFGAREVLLLDVEARRGSRCGRESGRQ